MQFEEMWRDLAPIGRSASSGGYHRSPWTSTSIELDHWFLQEASARGLSVNEDLVGNRVAWWGQPSSGGAGDDRLPGVVTGSHLDSVLDGGAYDGPLGVVSGFAAIDLLRDQGFVPDLSLIHI